MRVDPVKAGGGAYVVGKLITRAVGSDSGPLATLGIGAAALLLGARAAGVDLETRNVEGKGITAGKIGRSLESAGATIRKVSGEPRSSPRREIPAKARVKSVPPPSRE